MSSIPTARNIGALGFTLLLSGSPRSGEAKVAWDEQARLNTDFDTGRRYPAIALETALSRVEKNGFVSPLDFSLIMGVLVGFIQERAQ